MLDKMNINIAATQPWFTEVSEELLQDVAGFVGFLQKRLVSSDVDATLIQKKIDELSRWSNVAQKCVCHPENFDMGVNLAPEPVDILRLVHQGKMVQAISFGNGKPAAVQMVSSFNDEEDEETKFCDFSATSNLSVGYLLVKSLGGVEGEFDKRKIFVALTCTFDPRTKQVVRVNDEQVVLKVVGKTNNHLQDLRLRRESRVHGLLSLLGHDNINQLLRVGEDRGNIYTISAFGGSVDLLKHLQVRIEKTGHAMEESEVKELFKGILHSLTVVHNLGLAHRDLSLENFVLNENKNRLEVIDWGHCGKVDLESGLVDYEGALGKPRYFSPELVATLRRDEDGCSYDPRKADVFALGVCFYCCLLGEMPFEEMGKNPRTEQFLTNLRGLLKTKKALSPSASHLLERMLRAEPEKRISMQELLEHPFFK